MFLALAFSFEVSFAVTYPATCPEIAQTILTSSGKSLGFWESPRTIEEIATTT